jgi:glutamate dehydrogenase (NADP+)
VSGSGNVAQYAVEKLLDLGAKPVTFSDSGGTIHDPDGFDREKLAWVMDLKNKKRGRIKDYVEHFGGTFHEGQTPWSIPCDCAFPCATQNEISGEDAKALLKNGCTLVSEGANMPSEPEAIDAYLAAGILYGPGKAANAGGVATSGLEMSQNAMRISWPREEVDSRLDEIMVAIHENCFQTAEEYGQKGNYVIGANIAGFVKVAEAMLDQGVV